MSNEFISVTSKSIEIESKVAIALSSSSDSRNRWYIYSLQCQRDDNYSSSENCMSNDYYGEVTQHINSINNLLLVTKDRVFHELIDIASMLSIVDISISMKVNYIGCHDISGNDIKQIHRFHHSICSLVTQCSGSFNEPFDSNLTFLPYDYRYGYYNRNTGFEAEIAEDFHVDKSFYFAPMYLMKDNVFDVCSCERCVDEILVLIHNWRLMQWMDTHEKENNYANQLIPIDETCANLSEEDFNSFLVCGNNTTPHESVSVKTKMNLRSVLKVMPAHKAPPAVLASLDVAEPDQVSTAESFDMLTTDSNSIIDSTINRDPADSKCNAGANNSVTLPNNKSEDSNENSESISDIAAPKETAKVAVTYFDYFADKRPQLRSYLEAHLNNPSHHLLSSKNMSKNITSSKLLMTRLGAHEESLQSFLSGSPILSNLSDSHADVIRKLEKCKTVEEIDCRLEVFEWCSIAITASRRAAATAKRAANLDSVTTMPITTSDLPITKSQKRSKRRKQGEAPQYMLAEQCRVLGKKLWYYMGKSLSGVLYRLQILLLATECRKSIDNLISQRYLQWNSKSIVKPSLTLTLEALTPKLALDNYDCESLEFLGDKVLKFLAAFVLFQIYPKKREGFLTKRSKHYISNRIQWELAIKAKLEMFLRVVSTAHACCLSPEFFIRDNNKEKDGESDMIILNPDESMEGQQQRQLKVAKNGTIQVRIGSKRVADMLEALFGAYFLAGGLKASKLLIDAVDICPNISAESTWKDHTAEEDPVISTTTNINQTKFCIFCTFFCSLLDCPYCTPIASTSSMIMERCLSLEQLLPNIPPAYHKLTPSIIRDIESRIGYCFKMKEFLAQALTHCSYVHNNSETGNNSFSSEYWQNYERLEYLGDAVLDLVVVKRLFAGNTEENCKNSGEDSSTESMYPIRLDPSILHSIQRAHVCNSRLAIAGVKLGLHRFVYHGLGHKKKAVLESMTMEQATYCHRCHLFEMISNLSYYSENEHYERADSKDRDINDMDAEKIPNATANNTSNINNNDVNSSNNNTNSNNDNSSSDNEVESSLKVVADVFEAFIGAIFVDSAIEILDGGKVLWNIDRGVASARELVAKVDLLPTV